jgi:hypothetical protein
VRALLRLRKCAMALRDAGTMLWRGSVQGPARWCCVERHLYELVPPEGDVL